MTIHSASRYHHQSKTSLYASEETQINKMVCILHTVMQLYINYTVDPLIILCSFDTSTEASAPAVLSLKQKLQRSDDDLADMRGCLYTILFGEMVFDL